MRTKVREIKLKNNQIGVMLDIHRNGKRTQKMLKVRYPDVPKNALERQDKKEKKELVKKIIAQIELDNLYADNFLKQGYSFNKDFFEFCTEYLDSRSKEPNQHYYSAIKQLKAFCNKKYLPCSDIDEAFLLRFKKFLENQLTGVSPFNYFKLIKKLIKEATYQKYLLQNPGERIKNRKGKSSEKETLTIDEIRLLSSCYYPKTEIKKAFLFSCLTGLRFCDVSRLKFKDIKDGVLDIVQQKTKERLILNLRNDTFKLIGKSLNQNDLVFNLPTYPCCIRHLKNWVSIAGIEKNITWHCSRHSFATSLTLKNENITTVSKLLGHKSIAETETYIRVAEMYKENAIKNLPSIF